MGEDAPGSSLDVLFDSFLARIEALQDVTPMLSVILAGWELNKAKDFEKFFEPYKQEDGSAKVPMSEIYEATRKLNERKKQGHGFSITLRSLFIGAFALYDGFVTDLTRFVLKERPDLTVFDDKELRVSEIFSFGNLDELKDALIEREVGRILRESYEDQFKILGNLFGMKLGEGLAIWPDFIEASQRRNLIVHADGRVSDQYLAICKRNGVAWPAGEPCIGQKLAIDRAYLDRVYRLLQEVGLKLGQAIVRKVLPNRLADADKFLGDYLYRLLEAEKYLEAATVGQYAANLPKYSTDELKRRIVVNYAQALKWLENDPECFAELGKYDWSATSESFQIAVAVLKDDFQTAVRVMRDIGKDSEWKANYREWPLFRKFRQSDQFKTAYEEIFAETFAHAVQQAVSNEITEQITGTMLSIAEALTSNNSKADGPNEGNPT